VIYVPPVNAKEFVIERIVEETPAVRSFYLAPRDGKIFEFLPGQFVLVFLKDREGNVAKRAYSISSSPNEKGHVRITVALHAEFTKMLFAKKQGDAVTVTGPYGNFTLGENLQEEAVFIAGGVGITPFFSMISWASERMPQKKMALFYSSREQEHLIFLKELGKVAEKNRNFRMALTITGETCPLGVECFRRRIDEKMLRDTLGNLSGKQYYICGPAKMVEGMIDLLETLGVENTKIKNERW